MSEGVELEVLRLQVHEGADRLSGEWDSLADELVAPPFIRPGWIRAWARAFSSSRVYVMTARRGPSLVGLMPFVQRRGVLSAPVNWHTPVFSFLAADEHVSAALAERFISSAPVRADLSFLDASDPSLLACRAAAERLHRPVIVRTVTRSPFVQIAGTDWQSYRARLPGKARREVERCRRRLSEQGRVELELVDRSDDLEGLLAAGFRLEGSGWKHERETAITSHGSTHRFYADVARWAHHRGWLLLAFLRVQGKPIAFDLCLRADGVTWVLKGGFDPSFRRFGPGTLLTYESLRAAFEHDGSSYELLGGDEPYKLVWAQTVRERVRFQAFGQTPKGRLTRLAWTQGRPAIQRTLAAVKRIERSKMTVGKPAPQRLLISGDEFHASLALVRALAASGYAVSLAVTLRGTYASRSRAVACVRHVPHAEQQPDAFVEAMARAVRDLGVAAVLPGTEASLIALANGADQLPCPVGTPTAQIVELATDKPRVLALASECGLHTPPAVAGTAAELRAQSEQFPYPAVLKPARTRLRLDGGGLAYYKARRLDGPHDLQAELKELPDAEWVVQPYMEGGLSAVAGVAWKGELLGAVHQRSCRIWPPDVGYSASAVTTQPDRQLEGRLAALLSRIGWSGIFQAQLLGERGGRRYLIDFNPRAYGSLALAVRAGANLPAAWAALVLGLEPPRFSYKAGVHYRLEHNDVRAILHELRKRELRSALTAIVPRRETAHAVFSARDPGPLLTTAEKFLVRRRHE